MIKEVVLFLAYLFLQETLKNHSKIVARILPTIVAPAFFHTGWIPSVTFTFSGLLWAWQFNCTFGNLGNSEMLRIQVRAYAQRSTEKVVATEGIQSNCQEGRVCYGRQEHGNNFDSILKVFFRSKASITRSCPSLTNSLTDSVTLFKH